MSSYEQLLTAPPALIAFVLPYAQAIGLPHLAEVAHIAIFSFLVSIALQRLSSVLCPRLFPGTYPKIRAKSDDWVSVLPPFPEFVGLELGWTGSQRGELFWRGTMDELVDRGESSDRWRLAK